MRLPKISWERWKTIALECFVLSNLAFLAVDIYLAHSVNRFQHSAEWIPLWVSVASPPILLMCLVLDPWRRKKVLRRLGLFVGFCSVGTGIAGELSAGVLRRAFCGVDVGGDGIGEARAVDVERVAQRVRRFSKIADFIWSVEFSELGDVGDGDDTWLGLVDASGSGAELKELVGCDFGVCCVVVRADGCDAALGDALGRV